MYCEWIDLPNFDHMARIMALDYGTKRTGIAVTDRLQIIATALDTVPTRNLFETLERYFENEEVSTLVVGAPRRLNDEPSALEQEIIGFLRKFRKRFPSVQIEREDERFTSQLAARVLAKGGMKRNQRRDKRELDKMSAVIILKSFLGHELGGM